MIADLFELHGWEVQFLGANTPASELLRLIRDTRPDVVGLSVSMFFNLPMLTQHIARIRDEFDEVEILLGGQAFADCDAASYITDDRVRHVADWTALDQFWPAYA